MHRCGTLTDRELDALTALKHDLYIETLKGGGEKIMMSVMAAKAPRQEADPKGGPTPSDAGWRAGPADVPEPAVVAGG